MKRPQSVGAYALLGVLVLSACGALPEAKTPRQALMEARTGFNIALVSFNAYGSQRPFCNDPGASPPPFCADRQVVIQGAQWAGRVIGAFDNAEKVLALTSVADQQWSAIAAPIKQATDFQAWVDKFKPTANAAKVGG